MDAFAVSISNGICFPRSGRKQPLLIAFMFGLFQGLMSIAGNFAGMGFRKYIENIDHWVALILLCFIGGKMIFDSIKDQLTPKKEACIKTFTLKLLLLQAVATSIDAFTVGIGLAVINVDIWNAALFISITTFIFCLIGGLIGKKFGAMLKEKAELLGGSLLIALGIKIFLDHVLI